MLVGRRWQTPLPPGRWDARLEDYEAAVGSGIPLQHLVDIVRSVVRTGRDGELSCGVIAVRTLAELRPPKNACVRIERPSLTGHDDTIERPVGDAVRLFWRIAIEKLGIQTCGAGP